MNSVLWAALGSGVGLAGLLWWQGRRFERFLADEERRVAEIAAKAPPPWADADGLARRLAELPPPVLRWLARSLGEDYESARMWVAHGEGHLCFAPGGGWKRLRSVSRGAVGQPALCYTGALSLGLGGLLWCRGREALLGARGAMAWRLWGAVPLADAVGGHLDQSALLRWFAEALCFPPALLPSRHVRWLPCAADPRRSARVVVTLGGTTATATVAFDGQGRFRELRSDDSYWRVLPDGSVQCMPWRARATAHRRFALGPGGEAAGVEIPTQLEAAWLQSDGSEFTHLRFTVTSLAAAA